MQSGFADGVGTLASFNFPAGVSMDAGGTFALVVRLNVMYRYSRGSLESSFSIEFLGRPTARMKLFVVSTSRPAL